MAKHKYIETPQKMWQLFTAYKEHTKANPVRKQVFVGKDGHTEYEERECPLTIEGFECYVMDNTNITYPDLTNYFDGKIASFKQFIPICSRIKRKIRQDQIKGGMVGIYNPSITQRLNNLAEKTDSRFVDGEGNDRSFKITLNIK